MKHIQPVKSDSWKIYFPRVFQILFITTDINLITFPQDQFPSWLEKSSMIIFTKGLRGTSQGSLAYWQVL